MKNMYKMLHLARCVSFGFCLAGEIVSLFPITFRSAIQTA